MKPYSVQLNKHHLHTALGIHHPKLSLSIPILGLINAFLHCPPPLFPFGCHHTVVCVCVFNIYIILFCFIPSPFFLSLICYSSHTVWHCFGMNPGSFQFHDIFQLFTSSSISSLLCLWRLNNDWIRVDAQ